MEINKLKVEIGTRENSSQKLQEEITKLRRELNANNLRIIELNEAVLSRTTSIVIDGAGI